MTSTREPTFAEALEAQLNRREPIESPFAPTPTPRPDGMAPGTFATPHADAVMNPRIVEQMVREREQYMKRISNTPGAGAYEFRYDVFILHRPPSGCFVCKLQCEQLMKLRSQAIQEGMDPNEIEPGFDFFNCSHNRRDEYIKLMNRAARKEIVVGSHREETLQSGMVQVCMSWGEPNKVAKPSAKNTDSPKTPSM